jgi:hypothetical protein
VNFNNTITLYLCSLLGGGLFMTKYPSVSQQTQSKHAEQSKKVTVLAISCGFSFTSSCSRFGKKIFFTSPTFNAQFK